MLKEILSEIVTAFIESLFRTFYKAVFEPIVLDYIDKKLYSTKVPMGFVA